MTTPTPDSPTPSVPLPPRRTITRDRLIQIVGLLDLELCLELHLDPKGGHAIVARVDESGRPVLADDAVVCDTVFIDVVDGGQS